MANHKVDYLTVPQERILSCIRQAILDDGDPPTVAELAARVGLAASTVHYQLRELETKAAIIREPHQPRGIRLA